MLTAKSHTPNGAEKKVDKPGPVEPALEQSPNPLWSRLATSVLPGPALQPKLTVSPPDDPYEREADRVAEQVMRMPDPGGGAEEEEALASSGAPIIQRMCAECEEEEKLQRMCAECEEEEEGLLQPEPAVGGGVPRVSPSTAGKIRSLRGGGEPLSSSSLDFFQPRLRADLSGVRVHAGAGAGETAQAVRARAFTFGGDIVFGAGEYRPESTSGQRLLAHELVHVLQQSAALPSDEGPIRRQDAPPKPEPPASEKSEEAAPSLLVEDHAEEVGTGQMRKSQFLAEVKSQVCQAVDSELAAVGRSTEGCPYLRVLFPMMKRRSAKALSANLKSFAPGAAGLTSARDYVPLVVERARAAAKRWAETGEISGLPKGIPTSLLGGDDSLLGSLGGLLFKSRPGGANAEASPEAVRARLGPGKALEGGVRSRMESALGASFGQVRTHTDPAAAGISSELNARAFAVGEHVAFGAGEYRPGTLVGDALIAHELAHVVQQGGGAFPEVMPQRGSGYGSLEDDADRSAVGAVGALWGGTRGKLAELGHSALPRLRSGLRLQRCGDDGGSTKKRKSTMAPLLVKWHAAGLLDPPHRPKDVAAIPPISISEEQAQELKKFGAVAGLLDTRAMRARTAPTGPAQRPAPGTKVAPPSPQAGPRPVGPPPVTIAPLAVGVGVGIAVFLYPRPTAPPWMDEMNPVTGSPYGSPQDYEWAKRLDPGQTEYLRRLDRQTTSTPAPEEDVSPDKKPVPQPVPKSDPEEKKKKKNCKTEYPGYPDCDWLQDFYPHYEFDSESEAFEALKRTTGYSNLRKEKEGAIATSGPCAGVGWHTNVRRNGEYVASLVGCPCCEDTLVGPITRELWGILWH